MLVLREIESKLSLIMLVIFNNRLSVLFMRGIEGKISLMNLFYSDSASRMLLFESFRMLVITLVIMLVKGLVIMLVTALVTMLDIISKYLSGSIRV